MDIIYHVFRFTLFVAVSSLLGLCYAQSARVDDSILDKPVPGFFSNDERAVDAILRFGKANGIPLGLVTSQQLCSIVFAHLLFEHASARSVLEEFVKKLPSYHWQIEDGVVVFTPDDIPSATVSFLSLKVLPYHIPEESLEAQAVYAWVDIRASLRPEEGTAFNILSPPKYVKWPSLTLEDMTVQQVLNRLVARKDGGVWILLPFEDLSKVADRRPFWVIGYSNNFSQGAAAAAPCLNTKHP